MSEPGAAAPSGGGSFVSPALVSSAAVDAILSRLDPRRIMVAGPGAESLAGSLEARGLDVLTTDLADPIPGRYDLAICLELCLGPVDAASREAAARLAAASRAILVRFPSGGARAREWLGVFADHGLWPDLSLDPPALPLQSLLLRADGEPLPEPLLNLVAELVQYRSRAERYRDDLTALERDTDNLRRELGSLRHEAEARWGEVERFRREAEMLRQEAAGLRKDWRILEKSPAWGAVSAYRRFFQNVIVPRPNLRSFYEFSVGSALRLTGGLLAPKNVRDAVAPKALGAGAAGHGAAPFDVATVKFLLMVSGAAGDSYRYRCTHQAEQIGFAGLTVDTVLDTDAELDDAVWGYDAFVIHRVPYTPMLKHFIERARARSKPVVFDCDDLVFDPKYARDIAALELMTRAERAEFKRGMKGYQKTLALCDAAVVSTEPLREAIEQTLPHMPVFVNRNAISSDMVRQADRALNQTERSSDGNVRIAYLSGTKTHHRDFDAACSALARVLDERSDVELLLVGHIGIPKPLQRFEERIRLVPFLPWQKLPSLLAEVDINLAPLELGNRFTDGKSALKYMEAALLGVPTIASATAAFQEAIRHGETGFLCREEQEWHDALAQLAADRELRQRVGRQARQHVLERHLTRHRTEEYIDFWSRVVRRFGAEARFGADAKNRLSIAFVLRAPIAPAGGGYRTIFRFARSLEERGHLVRLYVERIAHLADKTDEEIYAFCREHFGFGDPHIRVGHEQIEPSDVAIATNWPTAYVVDRIQNTRCRAYFIQDYEPSFYETSDPLRPEVERTYSLPLKKIAFGRSMGALLAGHDRMKVDHVDFALDRAVFFDDGSRSSDGPIRILFFARPGMKRRGFSVGAEALEQVARSAANVEFALYGMREGAELGFEYENLGELTSEEVAREMRRSHIHLSFSLTNVSWVPFEAMACGCAVVEARTENVSDMLGAGQNTCVLVEPQPDAVAETLLGLARDHAAREECARQGLAFIAGRTKSWEEASLDFERLVRQAVFAVPAPPK